MGLTRNLSIALIVPILLGCGATPPPETSAEPTIRSSAGCGTSAPLELGSTASFTMRVGELDREYMIHLPPGYDAASPTSLVLDFHGYTGTAASEETYTGLSPHADEQIRLLHVA